MTTKQETPGERVARLARNGGWIGVDLDGTLAQYEGWQGAAHIGRPVPKMLDRVKEWIAGGVDVRVFTARVSGDNHFEVAQVKEAISDWCKQHVGRSLPITCRKDYAMIELWDDRAVQVQANTGERADGLP